MPIKCFKKELLSNAYIVAGKPVAFQALDGNTGVIALDTNNPEQAQLIQALDAAAQKGRGGIVAISFQEMEDLKKNRPWTGSGRESKQEMLQALPPTSAFNPLHRKSAVVAPPAAAENAATAGAPATTGMALPITAPPAQPSLTPDHKAGPESQPLQQQAAESQPFTPATARVGRKPRAQRNAPAAESNPQPELTAAPAP